MTSAPVTAPVTAPAPARASPDEADRARAERRRRRSTLARRLAEHRDAGGTSADPRWRALGWDALEGLPDWCALDDAGLAELRTLAGAVASLSAIRRCVRGDVLEALRARLGEAALDALRRRPYASAPCAAELDATDRLDALLAESGARALAASVPDPIARALLHARLRAIGGRGATIDPEGKDGDEPGDEPGEEAVPERGDARVPTVALELRALARTTGAGAAPEAGPSP